MIKVHVTQQRMEGLSVGILRRVENGSPNAMVRYVAHFVVGENGHYLPEEEAVELLDELTVGELNAVAEQLNDAREEAAFPKG